MVGHNPFGRNVLIFGTYFRGRSANMNSTNNNMREDLLALTTTKPHWSRRDFIAGSIASGFALAAQPVSAQTIIHTSSLNIVSRMVKVPTENGIIPAYFAMPGLFRTPATPSSMPIMIVVQEIFGIHEHIRDVCRRFAQLGYLAIAPDLFYRQGDVTKMADSKDILAGVVAKVPDWQVMRDIDASVRWAEINGGSRYRLGITGFCWGGRITWMYTAHNDYVKAGVAWYGRLTGDKSAMTPQHPIDIVDNIRVPVLGLYGGDDAGIPMSSVEQMNAALGKKLMSEPSQIHVYPGTPHAFFADYRASYREQQARDAWDKCITWFRRNGVRA
jgi:carboxymethylenebutenolidase